MKNNEKLKYLLIRKVLPLILAGSITLGTNGCTNKPNNTDPNVPRIGSVNLDDLYNQWLSYVNGCGMIVSKNDLFNNAYDILSIDLENAVINDLKEDDKRSKTNSNYDICLTPEKFIHVIGDNHITWDDVIKATQNNNNLTNDLKDIIIEGINNLDKSKYNYDLSVLYYNLSVMKVVYRDIASYDVRNAVAIFQGETLTVYISNELKNNLDKQTFLHEVLGHASLNTSYEKPGVGRILVCPDKSVVYSGNAFDEVTITKIGLSFEEAFAEIIACDATNSKIKLGNGYPFCVTYMLTLMNALNGDMNEFANKGIDYIIELLQKNNMIALIRIVWN